MRTSESNLQSRVSVMHARKKSLSAPLEMQSFLHRRLDTVADESEPASLAAGTSKPQARNPNSRSDSKPLIETLESNTNLGEIIDFLVIVRRV